MRLFLCDSAPHYTPGLRKWIMDRHPESPLVLQLPLLGHSDAIYLPDDITTQLTSHCVLRPAAKQRGGTNYRLTMQYNLR